MNVQMNRSVRIEWIDVAKGIGILLVLFSHVITSFVRRGGSNETLSSVPVIVVASFFMPLFFFLSGIFINSALKKRFIVLFKSKFRRLMIPYFIWGIISVCVLSLYSHKNLIIRFFELPFRPIFVLWFVYSLFLSFLLFWVLQRSFSETTVLFISLILYIIGYIFRNYVDVDSFLKPIIGMFQNFVFVNLGFLVRKYFAENFDEKNKKNLNLMKIFVIFLFSFCMLIGFNFIQIKNDFFGMIIQLICALMGILSVCTFSKIISSMKFGGKEVFIFLGVHSMEIYLIHKIVIEILSVFISNITLNVFVFTLVDIMCTLVCCFLVIKVINKCHLNVYFFGA